ncbi:MAG: GNAT family N-acetyltransferase [Sulfurimonas sp. RIFCSPHIGHO2_12_FULL_36_9]|nr:MAG: GNAT family N-acetyltransferase [Sulfurimonas sp. RIFCSPHIGHO2_12_FULL_36_9]OHE02118.1 MAG: GNAT family N-acetyltransferase [Sulfurimonas sp. RIFCSPLOWO2_12_36_12]OHE07567.1 MAG: GNAT family N-acetyltransferase [Sulfurimonas sp. RIFCSPLOWO2_12_FULL_36_74]
MLHYAYRLDEANKKLQDFPELDIYCRFYGLSSKDLGLYALSEHKIAGGAWIRLLKEDDKANAFIDEETPILTIAVMPEFRNQGIGSAMLEQLFLEAGAVFERMSVSVLNNEKTVGFFKKHGFVEVENSFRKSPVDEAEVITMVKELPKERVVRPTDGYDPRKWMD